MAVTKAQLVVWALIAGFSAAGYSVLSRVKAPDGLPASVPVAAVMTVAPATGPAPAAKVKGTAAVALVANVLPEAIPEFPFPDDLVTASTTESQQMAGTVSGFVAVSTDAIPQIATIGGAEALADPAAEPEAQPEMAVAVAEEPPIPMPSRPMAAQPVRAVPLAQVKTLYVVADALNVRALPSTSGTVLQKLPLGFAVAAREQANEWVGFKMRDGSTGWMRTDYLSDTLPPQSTETSPVRVWTEPLNLMM